MLVEYAFLLVAVGVPALAGMMAGGHAMLKNYREARATLLAPFP